MAYTTSLGYTPAFTISKAGEDITGSFEDRLISIRVCSYEGDGEVDTVDIELDDRDWSIAEPSIGEGSATLEVSLGYREGVLYSIGTFQVDELHHRWMPKVMVLHGNSAGFNTAIKAPVISSYEGKNLGEIVGEIGKTAGVTASVDPSLAEIKIPYLNQHCSFGNLLSELERRFDGTAKFEDGRLSFTKRGTGKTVSGADVGTVTLNPEDIPTGDTMLNNYYSYSKVRAAYLDRTNNQLVWVESSVKGNPNSTVPFMHKQPYGSQAEAQAAADAQMSRLNRATKQGSVTLPKGDPSIRGGSRVILSGFRSGIDDTYVVRCATHSFTKDAGIGTVLDLYTDTGAEDADGGSADETPSTAPTIDDMAPDGSTVPLGMGGIGHQ